jgi:hypothetical protein
MAIKNLLKTGTYTRISSIGYNKGQVAQVELICYDSAPTKTFLELRTPITVTEGDYEYEEEQVETVETIHIFNFDGITDFETLEINPSTNMHSQIYTHLMTKSLFAGCISDV